MVLQLKAKEAILSKLNLVKSSKELTCFLLYHIDIAGKYINGMLASHKLVRNSYQLAKNISYFTKMPVHFEGNCFKA